MMNKNNNNNKMKLIKFNNLNYNMKQQNIFMNNYFQKAQNSIQIWLNKWVSVIKIIRDVVMQKENAASNNVKQNYAIKGQRKLEKQNNIMKIISDSNIFILNLFILLFVNIC